jgi:cytochrome c5
MLTKHPSLRITRTFYAACLLAIASSAQAQSTTPSTATPAASSVQTGAQIYQQTCAACHASGVANAPKLGDTKTWKPLIAEGQDVLTAHAWVGVRGMPAKGGRPDLSLDEFSKAVVYMARAAGGQWQDPDRKMMDKIRQEEQLRIASLKNKRKL